MLGKKLKKIREDLDFSQKEFADKLETNQQSISRYEKDERQPSIEFLQKLYNLGISIDSLLDKESSNREPSPTPEEQRIFEVVKKASNGDMQAVEQLQFFVDCLRAKAK